MLKTDAKYHIGQVLRHRKHPFRGVVFDVDAIFSNTDAWYDAMPEDARPNKDQPFYHLLAENSDSEYVAYVSEQNLLPDDSGEPIRHSQVAEIFIKDKFHSSRIGVITRFGSIYSRFTYFCSNFIS